MSESYIRAEIVRPKWTPTEAGQAIFGTIFNLAVRVLVLWWFFAAWFPQFGFTYWQLVLPVFAFRTMISRAPFGRQLK